MRFNIGDKVRDIKIPSQEPGLVVGTHKDDTFYVTFDNGKTCYTYNAENLELVAKKHQSNIDLEPTDYEEGFNDGLNKMWECIKNIVNTDKEILQKVYGKYTHLCDFMEDVTPQEAIKKLEEYENRIKVGDVVYRHSIHDKRIVTSIITENGSFPEAIQITSSGRSVTDYVKDLHKTNKHYDIEDILKQLGE